MHAYCNITVFFVLLESDIVGMLHESHMSVQCVGEHVP